MKRAFVLLAVLLTRCASPYSQQLSLASCAYSSMPYMPPALSKASVPPSTEKVTAAYTDAAQKAVAAVTADAVTPDYVRAVHDADRAARDAVTTLKRQGAHPQPGAVENARSAVKKLTVQVSDPSKPDPAEPSNGG